MLSYINTNANNSGKVWMGITIMSFANSKGVYQLAHFVQSDRHLCQSLHRVLEAIFKF